MKLNLEQIKAIATGAVRITETESGFRFCRFTAEQEELYKEKRPTLWEKCLAPSGVKLRFCTDSKHLRLTGWTDKATARQYYAIDVYKNGEKLGDIKNFDPEKLVGLYTTTTWDLGGFAGSFDLGDGEKEICIYLPWSVAAALTTVELDDGAAIVPVKRPKKLLCFGDSITHGYDARYPANKYATRLAAMLDADEYNKAIGGEIFQPWLAAAGDDIAPDYITVAYGTNDWSACQPDAIIRNCTGFYENLAKSYPNTPIFAITPVWRKDQTPDKPAGPFSFAEETIRETVRDLPNVTVIRGYDLIPHEENNYGDLRLHPNDDGFAHYAANLFAAIKRSL